VVAGSSLTECSALDGVGPVVELDGREVVPIAPPAAVALGPEAEGWLPGALVVPGPPVAACEDGLAACCCWAARSFLMMALSSVSVSTASGVSPSGRGAVIALEVMALGYKNMGLKEQLADGW